MEISQVRREHKKAYLPLHLQMVLQYERNEWKQCLHFGIYDIKKTYPPASPLYPSMFFKKGRGSNVKF